MSRAPVVYWDACVFISHFQGEQRPDPHETAGILETVSRHAKGEVVIATSIVCRTELLETKMTPAQAKTLELFMRRPDVYEVAIDRSVADKARALREEFGLESMDALHLASAILYAGPGGVMHTFDGAGTKKKKRTILSCAGTPTVLPLKIERPYSAQGVLFPPPKRP